jgi:hypothetical protein
MAYDYIRRVYGVDPKIGQCITHYGKMGVICRPGSNEHYLNVRFDGQNHTSRVHPTDEVVYLPMDAQADLPVAGE